MKTISKRNHALKLLFFAIALSYNVTAGNYYWVGGSGSWSDYATHWATGSGGIIFHTSIPTAADEVFFDSNSFTTPNDSVDLDTANIYCRSLHWNGITNSVKLYSSSFSPINIFGSLISDSLAQFQNIGINFESSATGNTISSLHVGGLSFNGPGSWTLTGPLFTGTLYHKNGTLNTNSQPIDARFGIESFGGQNRSLLLGTSMITAHKWDMQTANLTLDAAAATLNLISAWAVSCGDGFNYHNILMSGATILFGGNSSFDKVEYSGSNDITIGGNNSFDTLYLNNPGLTVYFESGKTQTITGTLLVNSNCNTFMKLKSSVNGVVATIKKTSGILSLNYVSLQDINTSGGAVFNATNTTSSGNVTGWNITAPAPRTLYWVGGGGQWNNQSHWSLLSGGPGGNCPPNADDDIYFDTNSFTANDSIEVTSAVSLHSMNWTGNTDSVRVFTNTAGSLSIYGSVTSVSLVQFQNIGIIFESSASGNTISSLHADSSSLSFNGPGSWTLTGPLFTGSLYHKNGTLNSGGQPIDARFGIESIGGQNRSLLLGTSVITAHKWEMQTANLTLDASAATLNLISAWAVSCGDGFNYHNILMSGATILFGGNSSFDKVEYSGSNDITFGGNNSFDTLYLNNPGLTVYFESGKTQTITGTLLVNSNCNTFMKLKSSVNGVVATIKKTSGILSLNYVSLQDINTSGGAVFNATNTTSSGNVTGWNITAPAPRTLYWVGGGGQWNNQSHWSLLSGGPGGNCPPNAVDDIHFNSNSFTANDSIEVTNAATFHSMNWTGNTDSVRVFTNTAGSLTIYGSVSSDSLAQFQNLAINFESTATGNTIGSFHAGSSSLYFKGPGSWMLTGPLFTGNLYHENGILNSNSQPIDARFGIESFGGQNRSFHLGTSVITAHKWDMQTANLTLDASAATLNLISAWAVSCGDAFNYHNVLMSGLTILFGGNSSFDKVEYSGSNDIRIGGNNSFDTLYLNNPGHTVEFESGKTQTITGNLKVNSNANQFLRIASSVVGSPTFITSASGSICLDYVILKDIAANGTTSNAGIHSVDLGGNSGWTFTNCINLLSSVWPGDANSDLVANNVDLLNIGLGYNDTGSVRSGASNNWLAQSCADWSSQFLNGANLKHADCNGDGIINSNDTVAILLNYGLTHPKLLPQVMSPNAPLIYMQFAIDTAQAGDTLSFSIGLGTATQPADSVYGIAFTINYDNVVVDSASVFARFNNSWIGTKNVDMISLQKDNYTSGKIEIALTGIDHLNRQGYGTIGVLSVDMKDDLSGRDSIFKILHLSFSNVILIDKDGNEKQVNSMSDSLVVAQDVTSIKNISVDENAITLSPNPAKEVVNIDFSKVAGLVSSIKIYNAFGQEILERKIINETKIQVHTSQLSTGIYYVKVKGTRGLVVKKLVVTK